MKRHEPPRWRSIRVPLRAIERTYGRDHADDASDDMIHALRHVSEWPDQYRCRFSLDTGHANSWYHAVTFEVEGVPDALFERLIELLTERGLAPELC